MAFVLPFFHLVFVGIVSLFPPVNPLGSALIVDPFLNRLTKDERKSASFKIALYCFIICSSAALAGSWLLMLFGISLPVVKVAGGILICRMGWQLLSPSGGSGDSGQGDRTTGSHGGGGGRRNVDDILFYPLAFPMTTGAGTISVLLTLSAHGQDNELAIYILNLFALFVAILAMCAMIYVCYAFTPRLLARLGVKGRDMVNRLSAFLVFCVGIQIASGGLLLLFKPSP